MQSMGLKGNCEFSFGNPICNNIIRVALIFEIPLHQLIRERDVVTNLFYVYFNKFVLSYLSLEL